MHATTSARNRTLAASDATLPATAKFEVEMTHVALSKLWKPEEFTAWSTANLTVTYKILINTYISKTERLLISIFYHFINSESNSVNLSDRTTLRRYIAGEAQLDNRVALAGSIATSIYETNPRPIQDNIGEGFGNSYSMEPELLAWLMQATRNEVFVELGAAWGQHSKLLALSGATRGYVNERSTAEHQTFAEWRSKQDQDLKDKLIPDLGDALHFANRFPELREKVGVLLARNFIHFLNRTRMSQLCAMLHQVLKPGGYAVFTANCLHSFGEKARADCLKPQTAFKVFLTGEYSGMGVDDDQVGQTEAGAAPYKIVRLFSKPTLEALFIDNRFEVLTTILTTSRGHVVTDPDLHFDQCDRIGIIVRRPLVPQVNRVAALDAVVQLNHPAILEFYPNGYPEDPKQDGVTYVPMTQTRLLFAMLVHEMHNMIDMGAALNRLRSLVDDAGYLTDGVKSKIKKDLEAWLLGEDDNLLKDKRRALERQAVRLLKVTRVADFALPKEAFPASSPSAPDAVPYSNASDCASFACYHLNDKDLLSWTYRNETKSFIPLNQLEYQLVPNLKSAKFGDLLLYSTKITPAAHFAIYAREKAVSKWGKLGVFEGDTEAVDVSSGYFYRIFRKKYRFAATVRFLDELDDLNGCKARLEAVYSGTFATFVRIIRMIIKMRKSGVKRKSFKAQAIVIRCNEAAKIAMTKLRQKSLQKNMSVFGDINGVFSWGSKQFRECLEKEKPNMFAHSLNGRSNAPMLIKIFDAFTIQLIRLFKENLVESKSVIKPANFVLWTRLTAFKALEDAAKFTDWIAPFDLKLLERDINVDSM